MPDETPEVSSTPAVRVRVANRSPRDGAAVQPAAAAPSTPAAPSGLFIVKTPTGMDLEVMIGSEVTWYDNQRDAYLRERDYTRSDKVELDQLLALELQVTRFSSWVSSGKRYNGKEISLTDIGKLQLRIRDAMQMTRIYKDSLGLSRAARRSEAASPQEYLLNLRQRAREFGEHRNEQIISAIALWKELQAHVGAFDRSNERERHVIGFTSESDIVQWCRTKFAEFDEIDAEFRKQQGVWVGTL